MRSRFWIGGPYAALRKGARPARSPCAWCGASSNQALPTATSCWYTAPTRWHIWPRSCPGYVPRCTRDRENMERSLGSTLRRVVLGGCVLVLGAWLLAGHRGEGRAVEGEVAAIGADTVSIAQRPGPLPLLGGPRRFPIA